jgi:WD40 repeat protein
MSDILQQAIEAIKVGDEQTGEVLLSKVLKADPHNETALMWLFKIADTFERRRQYVEWTLQVNPNSRWAKRAVNILKMEQAGREAAQGDSSSKNDKAAKPGASRPLDLPKLSAKPVQIARPEPSPPKKREHDDSFLLRGDDLSDVEPRLTQTNENPEQSSLPGEHIVVGRHSPVKRQPMMLGVVTIGLVISIVLAIVAFFQFIKAEEQRKIAEENALRALSRQLAAQSILYSGDQLDLALLLNLEAVRIAESIEGEGNHGVLADLDYDPHLIKFLHGHNDVVRQVVFSPDSKTLASSSRDHNIILWDTETGQLLGLPLTGHTDWVLGLAFSPDGQILTSTGRDKTVRLWDVVKGEPMAKPFNALDNEVKGAAFSPDGQHLATASIDGEIILWDVFDHRLVRKSPRVHPDGLNTFVFSPNGQMLASGGNDGLIILWDVDTLEPLGSPLTNNQDVILTLAFSPDSKTLASDNADSTIALWDVAARELTVPPLKGHTNRVLSMSFSPDGQLLASGSSDNTIMVWNVESGTPLGPPLTGHTNVVSSVHFSPDGQKLASGGSDSNIMLWDVNVELGPRRACEIANRNLTREEWNQFIGAEQPYRLTCPDFPSGLEQ